MISKELARRFIARVTKYTEYNVNIMDENGMIIASRDPERLGQYHAIAHQIIQGGEELVEAKEGSYRNVHRGINMVIEVDGKREGVVGVTGDPAEIRVAALMTKMALETMLRYEQQQEERRRRENRKEQFIYLLTQVEDARHEELLSLASDLGFPEEMIRIPILLWVEDVDSEELLMQFRSSALHSPRDFSIAPDPSHVLVFKTLPISPERLLIDYKEFVLEYISGIRNHLKQTGRKPRFFVGSYQENYKQYYYAYRHCKWLENSSHINRNISRKEDADEVETEVIFFYEHMNEYLQHIAPVQEFRHIFHILDRCFPEKMEKMMVETILALHRNNFSFPQAAKELFIHKNTLVYRYNQIKDFSGLDPVASAEDRAFLVAFCVYLDRVGGV